MKPKEALQKARLAQGESITIEELARRAGITEPAYYDLENIDDELIDVISIHQLFILCQALHVSPEELFGTTSAKSSFPTWKTFASLVSKYGDTTDWQCGRVGENPELIFRFPIDAMQSFCSALRIDWKGMIQYWFSNEDWTSVSLSLERDW